MFPLTQECERLVAQNVRKKSLVCEEKLEHTVNQLILNNYLQIYQQLILGFVCKFA